MHVCMVAYSFYASDNRIRRYAESLVRRGDSVDVIALAHPDAAAATHLNGVRVFAIQKRAMNENGKSDYFFRTSLFLLRSFLFLTRRHVRARYDLIHVHSVPDYEVFAALIPKLLGAKVILDIHDIVPEFYAGKFNTSKTSSVYRALVWIERICCRFSDHVVISNDLWARTLTARSVRPAKCTTILNYPDPTIFHTRNSPRPPGGPFTLVYPGTLNRHQGVDIAIQAMVRVVAAEPETELHIYGRGPEESNLKRLVERLLLTTHVKFMGNLPLEEVVLKMEAADAGVVPKRADGFGNEAFSTKIFEFMTLDVPVIVSRTKIDQFYFNDSLVLFFEPDDAADLADKIIGCIRDRALRTRLILNSRTFIQEYSWEVKKDMYFKLVDELVACA